MSPPIMRRNWNLSLWLGFALVLFAVFSYVPLFVPFPVTRDFPWATLLLFAAGGFVLSLGVRKAFRNPRKYRGKVAGPILALASLALFGLFCEGVFVFARKLPSPAYAARVGQQAPGFTLTDTRGTPVSLSQLVQGRRGVLLIFYRGYW